MNALIAIIAGLIAGYLVDYVANQVAVLDPISWLLALLAFGIVAVLTYRELQRRGNVV